MKAQDIRFFQKIAEQIVLYCAGAEITNENAEELANKQRALFSLVNKSAAADAENNVDLKLNQNLQFWTAKEIDNMPFLKDLKYRVTKDGIHQFRYRRDGYDVSFNSKKLEIAKQKAREFLSSLKKQPSAVKVRNDNCLSHVAELWFNTKKNHVDSQTLNGYYSVYKNHILPAFGKRSIRKILPIDLQPFFDDLFGRLGKTCENAKIILNGIFKFAVANRICPTNPMDGVIIERHARNAGKRLTDEQIKRFVNVMATVPNFGIAYLIILYTGIRGAELESLQFDWIGGTFTVKNAKLKKSQRLNPQNLTRTVPIFPGLYSLRNRIESEFWRIDKRRISNYLSKNWKETSVKDLRHTFSSKAREVGIDNELVNIWMGHTPGKNLTANVYTHFSIEYQKKEAEKLNNY